MIPIRGTKMGYVSLFLFALTVVMVLIERDYTLFNLSLHHFPELIFFYAFGLYLGECGVGSNRVLFLYSGTVLGFLLFAGQTLNVYMFVFAVVLSLGLPVGYFVERWFQIRKG